MLRTKFDGIFGRLHLDDLLNPVLEHPANRRRYQVLVYHKVSPDPHPSFQPTSPSDFEQQILFLKQHYSVFDLEELVDRSVKKEIPKKAVAVTFDDGYRDNYDFAFPILRKHGIPATIFLTASAIENRQKIWHDRIFDSFRFATKHNASLVLNDVIRRAKTMCGNKRIDYVKEVEEMLAPEIPDSFSTPMLSWNQVLEMHKAGMAFGSHTCTHPILSREEPSDVRKELINSKDEIQQCLGTSISLLAYPNGQKQDFSRDVTEAAHKAGYKCAFTTICGFNRSGDNLYELRRGQPWQNDPSLFRFRFFLQRHLSN